MFWAGICSANGGYRLANEDLKFGEVVEPLVDEDGTLYSLAEKNKEDTLLE